MLTACGSSPKGPPPIPLAPDPIVEVRTRVQLVCPAELDTAARGLPAVPADAEIVTNVPGGAWLSAVFAAFHANADQLTDAAGACAEQRALGAPQ